MDKSKKVYIAGHRGMVGSAILRKLKAEGFTRIITRTSKELDLRNQHAVGLFFQTEKPDYVFLAAAKVGGILANNTYRADFIYDNIMIQSNVIHEAYQCGVSKLLFLGSSCIYPKLAEQPLREEALLTGALEPTNEPYAIAKIAGIKMCDAYRAQYDCDFISVMPTNLYGPNDNYDLETSHVLPALLRKFHEAKVQGKPEVVMWGTGSPKREFLHVDDLAEACYYLMEHYSESGLVNIGTGRDLAILDLAKMIKNIVGYEGVITHDLSKPDGTPRKLMDVRKLEYLGWKAGIPLDEGIRKVYQSVDKTTWDMNLEFGKDLDKQVLFDQARAYLDSLEFNVASEDSNRPWGGFFVLEEGQAFRFLEYFFPGVDKEEFEGYSKLSPKILLVAPGKRLSWQYHHRRSEIWRLVGGGAQVIKSDTDEQTEPQGWPLGGIVELKQGERHRIIGSTEGWGMVAEIWKHTVPGDPSDESDIVRLQDDFGR